MKKEPIAVALGLFFGLSAAAFSLAPAIAQKLEKGKKLGGTSAHSYQPPARIPPVNDVADGNYRYCYDKRPQQVYHQSRQYHEDSNDYPIKRS
jgi:hypothetical protein